MALVERLMNLETPRIPIHDFFAMQSEIIRGPLTVAVVKSMLNMDTAAQVEYDLLVATAPTGISATELANKALFLHSQHSIFILAEGRYPGYSTPTEVRLQLGI